LGAVEFSLGVLVYVLSCDVCCCVVEEVVGFVVEEVVVLSSVVVLGKVVVLGAVLVLGTLVVLYELVGLDLVVVSVVLGLVVVFENDLSLDIFLGSGVSLMRM